MPCVIINFGLLCASNNATAQGRRSLNQIQSIGFARLLGLMGRANFEKAALRAKRADGHRVQLWKRERPTRRQAPPSSTVDVQGSTRLRLETAAGAGYSCRSCRRRRCGTQNFTARSDALVDFHADRRRSSGCIGRSATASVTHRVDGVTRATRAGWGSTRGDLAPSLSYEVLAKAKKLYREDYLLYERLKRADVRARAETSRRPPRHRRVAGT